MSGSGPCNLVIQLTFIQFHVYGNLIPILPLCTFCSLCLHLALPPSSTGHLLPALPVLANLRLPLQSLSQPLILSISLIALIDPYIII